MNQVCCRRKPVVLTSGASSSPARSQQPVTPNGILNTPCFSPSNSCRTPTKNERKPLATHESSEGVPPSLSFESPDTHHARPPREHERAQLRRLDDALPAGAPRRGPGGAALPLLSRLSFSLCTRFRPRARQGERHRAQQCARAPAPIGSAEPTSACPHDPLTGLTRACVCMPFFPRSRSRASRRLRRRATQAAAAERGGPAIVGDERGSRRDCALSCHRAATGRSIHAPVRSHSNNPKTSLPKHKKQIL